ncbi:MAG: PEP-CTERM sorting domain-containing protein [Verrucomicrobiota bacterium]
MAKHQTKHRLPSLFAPGRGYRTLAIALTATVTAWVGSLQAGVVLVPNGSFESPTTAYVGINIDSWQKANKPGYFDEVAYGFSWIQTAGLFLNTAVGQPDHIDNVDGNQSAYLLAFPQVALSQDLTAPDAKFNIGSAYDLTVGLLGKGMADGSSLLLSLYYRDGGNNPVTVVSTTITYTAAALPSTTHLTDFQVQVPIVQPGDAWAGQNIGVKVESAFGAGAGYWDMDNVRLVAVPEPGVPALISFGFIGFMMLRRFSRGKS